MTQKVCVCVCVCVCGRGGGGGGGAENIFFSVTLYYFQKVPIPPPSAYPVQA